MALNLTSAILPFLVQLSVLFIRQFLFQIYENCVIPVTAKILDFYHEKYLAGNLKLAEFEY